MLCFFFLQKHKSSSERQSLANCQAEILQLDFFAHLKALTAARKDRLLWDALGSMKEIEVHWSPQDISG